tara:strand:- start:100 stop:288 length:189 start_codon:yes stop_codon:yes gene_type:complete
MVSSRGIQNFGVKASVVQKMTEENSLPFKIPSEVVASKADLSHIATVGSVYLTYWMIRAQIE